MEVNVRAGRNKHAIRHIAKPLSLRAGRRSSIPVQALQGEGRQKDCGWSSGGPEFMEDGFHCVATGMADPADDLFATKFLPIVGGMSRAIL
jgi:hypothetical protein